MLHTDPLGFFAAALTASCHRSHVQGFGIAAELGTRQKPKLATFMGISEIRHNAGPHVGAPIRIRTQVSSVILETAI